MPGASDWFVMGVLIACVAIYTELSRPIEREWRSLTESRHLDVGFVWIFAAVLTVPPVLMAVTVLISFAYPWLRGSGRVLYQELFRFSVASIAAFGAKHFLSMGGFTRFPETRDVRAFAVVVAAAVLFLLITTALTAVALHGATPGARLRDCFAAHGDYAHEAASLGLGVLTAWALAAWPPAVLLIIGVTLVLHRSVLIRQLRESARADGKTGLLKPDAWRSAATTALGRDSPASLLMIDVDHFKRVNDVHGHLVGDDVLRTVADTLKAEVRTGDLVGRYGGDEFVVFLSDTTGQDAMAMAERIRRRVTRTVSESIVDVSISIGVAVSDDGGLDELLHAADSALYEAKGSGRNRTAMSTA